MASSNAGDFAAAPLPEATASTDTTPVRAGTRAANRAAKRAASGGVRPKTQVRGPAKRSSTGSSTGLILLAAIAVMVVVAVIVIGNPFGSATPSPSPVAYGDGTCPTSQPASLASDATKYVTISTDLGDIVIKVDGSLSPIAAGNFVALASCHYYDGVVFHRTAALQDGTPFVIQGGDPDGTGAGPGPGYTIQDEPVTTAYKRGTVAMARTSQPNSQGSQFFIVLDDKDGSVLSSANTYAIFGDVVQGMDVADAIFNASNGAENPADPVVMNAVTVSDTPPPSTAPTAAPTSPAATPAASPAAS